MKLWVDDVRKAPQGYLWAKSTNEAVLAIQWYSAHNIEVIDIDHDAGDYAFDGGDYIKVLDYLEERGLSIPIHIHSMNPVGVENMRRIIQKNGWKEV